MSERYTVHRRSFGGDDRVIGHFTVENGAIHYDNKADEYNCNIFPAGPIAPATERRLTTLLNNPSKSVYIVSG